MLLPIKKALSPSVPIQISAHYKAPATTFPNRKMSSSGKHARKLSTCTRKHESTVVDIFLATLGCELVSVISLHFFKVEVIGIRTSHMILSRQKGKYMAHLPHSSLLVVLLSQSRFFRNEGQFLHSRSWLWQTTVVLPLNF